MWYGPAGQVCAAIGYTGAFPGGSVPGGLVLLGFPFETITTRAARDSVMRGVFAFLNGVTSADGPAASEQPGTFAMEQNFPNPFNPATTIRFSLAREGQARLAIYDLLGRLVGVPVDGVLKAGLHEAVWHAADVASGVYFCVLTAAEGTRTRSMLVIK
jgi:hypothetical protein